MDLVRHLGLHRRGCRARGEGQRRAEVGNSLLGCREEWCLGLGLTPEGEGSNCCEGSSSGPREVGVERHGARRGKAQDRRVLRRGRGEHCHHILDWGQPCLRQKRGWTDLRVLERERERERERSSLRSLLCLYLCAA